MWFLATEVFFHMGLVKELCTYSYWFVFFSHCFVEFPINSVYMLQLHLPTYLLYFDVLYSFLHFSVPMWQIFHWY